MSFTITTTGDIEADLLTLYNAMLSNPMSESDLAHNEKLIFDADLLNVTQFSGYNEFFGFGYQTFPNNNRIIWGHINCTVTGKTSVTFPWGFGNTGSCLNVQATPFGQYANHYIAYPSKSGFDIYVSVTGYYYYVAFGYYGA